MTADRRTSNQNDALSWTLIGTALVAMVALYFTSKQFSGLPMMAGLMVVSRFVTWRLPGNFLVQYGSRAAVLIIVLTLINQNTPEDTSPWYLKQEDTNLAGYAVAADLVLRAWSRRDPARAREALGVVVLMTALLFAASTNTYRRQHIQLLTPIYILLLLLSLRSFTAMQQPIEFLPRARRGLVLLRTIALALALSIAFAGTYAVTRYEYQVTRWAMQFVRQRQSDRPEIGFTTSPRLSNVFNPLPSLSRLLLIDGKLTEPHLRAVAYDIYGQQQWMPIIGDRTFTPVPHADPPAESSDRRLLFTRLGDTADVLMLPLVTEVIHCDDPLEEDHFGTLRDRQGGSDAPYTTLNAIAPTFQGPLSIAPDATLRDKLLSITSEIDPKVIELAKRVAGEGEPAKRVFRLQEYLRGRHAYSMSYRPVGEPLNDFILNDRAAHCQYFASALVIMSRAAGVPARYVTGCYAHEAYGNGQTIVRQRDAHAWAECWIDGAGWTTFDATPSTGRPDEIFSDPPAWRRWWEKLGDLPGAVRAWVGNHSQTLQLAAGIAGLVALLMWLYRWLRERSRRIALQTRSYPQPGFELREMSRRFEKQLRRRGLPCPPEATWCAYLAMNEEHDPLFDRFITTYNRARFGDEDSGLVNARELLQQIENYGHN